MERRKFMRFPVLLEVEAKREDKQAISGVIKEFSREGLRVIFDNFDFNPFSNIDLRIQRPDKDIFIPAGVEVIWKRPIEGRWEAGLRLKEFPHQVKAEILEQGYKRWLKEKLFTYQ